MKEKILVLLKEELPDIDFESSERLVDDGIMDSISMVEIISLLTDEFGITIPYEDIIAENFNSVSAMADLVERYQL